MISMLLLAAVLGAAPLPDDFRTAPIGDAFAVDEITMPQQKQRGRQDDKDTDKDDKDTDKDDKDTDRDDDTDTDTERNRRNGRVVCADRDNNGLCDDRRRRADVCVDRDKDGFCDAGRRDTDDFCVDRDNDGRCDGGVVPRRFPEALPEMLRVAVIRERGRTADVNRWLGGVHLRVRYTDADKNGVPERISFFKQGGELLQLWVDRNGDGRADQVHVFHDGKRVRTLGG